MSSYVQKLKIRAELISKRAEIQENVDAYYNACACYKLWSLISQSLFNLSFSDLPEMESESLAPKEIPEEAVGQPVTITVDLKGKISDQDIAKLANLG